MRSTRCLLCLSLALLVLISPAADAADVPDDQPLTISGTLVDADGSPVSAAEVKLRKTKNGQRVETTTNTMGEFTLTAAASLLAGNSVEAVIDSGRKQARIALPYEASKVQDLGTVDLKLATATKVNVVVNDASGQPVSDATVVASDDRFVNTVSVTDAGGKCEFWILDPKKIRAIAAIKNGFGLDYRSFEKPRDAYSDLIYEADKIPINKPVVLTLGRAAPVEIRIVNSNDDPVAGVRVTPWYFQNESQASDLNISYVGTKFEGLTDADGRISFDWIPDWQESQMVFWLRRDDSIRDRIVYDPSSDNGSVTFVQRQFVPIRGIVTDQLGQVVPDAIIRVAGAGYAVDDFRGSVQSDSDGRYEIEVAPDQIYIMVAEKGTLRSAPLTGFKSVEGEPIEGKIFVLLPGTRIHGLMTEAERKNPVEGVGVRSYQYGLDAHNTPGLELPNPDNKNTWLQPMLFRSVKTEADGSYEFFVGPGKHDLRARSTDQRQEFEITDQRQLRFDLHSDPPPELELTGTVVDDETGQPLAGVKVTSIYQASTGRTDPSFVTNSLGEFKGIRLPHRMTLHATNADRTKAAIVGIAAETKTVKIAVVPLGRATGVLFDEASDSVSANTELSYSVQVYMSEQDSGAFRSSYGGTTHTDTKGHFTLDNLIVGHEYCLSRVNRRDDGEIASWTSVTKLTLDVAKELDLGTVRIAKPYVPPTLKQRVEKAFANKDRSTQQRLQSRTRVAKRANQHVLVLAGTPDDAATKRFFELLHEERTTRTALLDYAILAVDDADAFPRPDNGGFSMTVLDLEGNTLAETNSNELQVDEKLDAEKMIEFLDSCKPNVLDARQLLQQALAQAKLENKRVLVQESATWCGPCHLLSQLLIDRQAIWDQDYIWVKLDHRWDGARQIGKDYRDGEHSGIPWWAILDQDGTLLISSIDENGDNIGFPSSDAGQKHFRKMVESTRIRLTDEEVNQWVAQ